jgi:hypothetical protein
MRCRGATFLVALFPRPPDHFFLSRALKRTREHAKGHAMLCMCVLCVDAPESPVAKTWSGEREWVAASAFCSVCAQLIHFASRRPAFLYLLRTERERCYICWLQLLAHALKKSTAAACELQFCAFLPPDWWCWVQNSILSPKTVWCYRSKKKLANLDKWSGSKISLQTMHSRHIN